MMPQTSFFKVTTGIYFSVLSTFECDRAMRLKEINAFIDSVGAHRNRWVAMGTLLEGLYYGPLPAPKGWRAMGKTHRGYYRPDTRYAEGKKYRQKLESLKLLTGEDLAHALKLPPFFEDGGTWCTSAESTMIGGVFYLMLPSVFSQKVEVLGVQEITYSEYLQATKQAKGATA